MKSLKKIAFWDWLYSLGQQPLTEEVYGMLKTDFVYHKAKKQSKYEGELHEWDFETLLIELPIHNDYCFCLFFHLNKKAEFEENLYLKYKGEFYIIGWFDCHNHEMVFQFEEFYSLMQSVKSNPKDDDQYNVYFLLLARYVTLIHEKNAAKLMTDAISAYSKLLNSKKETNFDIAKIEPYGNKIFGTDWMMKLKKIKALTMPLHFTINEGVSWKLQKNNRYHLYGFAAHSMRNAHFDKGLKKPIDIYEVTTDSSTYKFPYELWNDLMRSCL
ncbi:hypothetical protein [Aureispira anguillae]|uniref:Uncharacterized protein n=1 Tax=Aureispira anguillae TaxID=2864201 RepID=A0A915YDF7_9BACT|nr:hypothetical protein [Aureispira anguillae]BDS11060.1 hypothetical protein AsAng_0017710 [Aureispira anguillae]